jgi:hypothetical protein
MALSQNNSEQEKKASSLIVEFTKPEHANMAIEEGLIIEAAMQ